MVGKLVPTAPTRVTVSDLYAAIRRIWPALIADVTPTRQALVLICAHSALETGFWHACWCWNLGNFKHTTADGRDYFTIRHYEIQAGQTVWIDPPNDPFIAFRDLDDGVSYYLSALRGRWRGAWPFLTDGDVAGFVHALKIAGYYTASEISYRDGVDRCMHQLEASIPPDTVPDLAEVAHEAMAEAQNELDETTHDPPPEPKEG